MDVKKTLAELLYLKEVVTPASSIFVEHGYLRDEVSGWRSSHKLRYNTYLIPSRYHLKDTVAFAYRANFAVIKKLITRLEKKE